MADARRPRNKKAAPDAAAELRRQAKALIQIKRCKINRLENGTPEGAGRRAVLSAECEIDWITLRGAARP